MLLPASSEFIALCRSQVRLLTHSLDAALSIVYLSEELTDVTDRKLVPVVAYPEAVASWGEDRLFSLLAQGHTSAPSEPRLIPDDLDRDQVSTSALSTPSQPDELRPSQAAEQALLRQQQIILPLMYQEMVMGLLVTARADRAWTEQETTQIKQIAETLAIACLLDQRTQWLAQDMRQQRLLRDQKYDLFDTLLHQFRNPLTALRTFGKLLLKRLKTDDANRSVVEGIIRESDRLQELLQQFNAAVDFDEGDLRQLFSASELEDQDWIGSDPEATKPPQHQAALPPALPAALAGSTMLAGGLQLAPHPIIEVLHPLLESAEAIAGDRQLTVHRDIPTHLPPVHIDPRALREVLSNLLDNALKYTASPGDVGVWVRSDAAHSGQQAVVIVDTGPGIPESDRARLFERHYRGVQANTDIPGTGLGLAIARDLIQQMGGEIQVFSPAHTCDLIHQRELPDKSDDKSDAPTSPGTAVVVWLPEQSDAV